MATSRIVPRGTENNLAAGHTPVTKALDATLTVAEVSNTIVSVTAARTMTLPAATPGLACVIIAQGANIIHADPNGTEVINGIGGADSPAAGRTIDSSGTNGDAVYLRCNAAGVWTVTLEVGTWVYAGA